MAIIGIGTDIEETARFQAERVTLRLLNRVFTPAELEYCRSQKRPELHLAARFAAKEATVKALISIAPKLMVSQVEVLRADTGAASIRLVRGLRSSPPPTLPDGVTIHVSLSHTAEYASAVVVVEIV